MTVTYLPSALTGFDDEAVLILETDDPQNPAVEVLLSGRAIRPVIVVSTTALDFGPVLVGTTPSPTRTFTIRNDGVGPLVVSDVTAPGLAVYTRTTSVTLPAVLQPFASMTATVTYTPAIANVVASSSLEVRSSDLDRGPVTVTITGSSGGCPPRANASVQVVGDQCIYSCLGGFHGCGDACLSNTSPDSCGTSCTPCQNRNNAVRGCTQATSTCTYSCDADARDLNSNLSVSQTSGSDGCEYQCPIFPTRAETCDTNDEDCDGLADEGLPADTFDRAGGNGVNTNDVCTVADAINAAPEGGVTTINANIYPMPSINGNDEDWYRVEVDENDALCVPFSTERYRVVFRLSGIPVGSDYDLSVHPDDNGSCASNVISGCGGFLSGASGTGSCVSARSSNVDDGFHFDFDGTCAFDDNRFFRVRVRRFSGGACGNYQLSVAFNNR